MYLNLSPLLSVCAWQDREISRLRASTLALKRDLEARCQQLQNSAVQLDKAKTQAQLNHEQAEDLRREKSDLEKQMTVTKQKVAEVNA